MDFALNNLQSLICHKNKPTHPTNQLLNQTKFFYGLRPIKINNLYSLDYVLKHKIWTEFHTKIRTCSHKNAASLW